MKNILIIAIAFLFTLASCTSTYQAASAYDDVYYTPKNSNQAISSSSKSNASKVIYSGSSSLDDYQQTSDPQSVAVDERDYKSYNYVEDTLPSAASSDEYYYVEESEEYYDYDYASRIDRFYNNTGSFGYYAPVYTGYYPSYGPSLSIGYGWGMPSSYFSFGFNYGWGGGYYNPWCYDPWYCNSWYGYPYYGYGGSYWAGYNNGYWNGYYAGGGGYYPGGGETIYPGYYNGPRNSRGSSIVGTSGERGSRVDGGNESEIKNTVSSGRGSRVDGSTGAGTSVPAGTQTQESQRTSRSLEPQQSTTSTETRETRSEKLTKPGSGQVDASAIGQENTSRQENTGTPEISRKYAAPQSNATVDESSRNARAQEKYSQTPSKQYDKPVSSQSREDVYSRSKKYAKPASESLSGNTQTGETKKYTSPNTNRPRSSNEYTVPRSNQTRTYTTPSRSQNSFSSPKRSTNSYSAPSRSNTRNYTPTRSTSTPSRSYSTPSRSYSTPTRSSGSSGNSYSAPSRSSGSGSGSSGTSRSSGSSSGGKRGR